MRRLIRGLVWHGRPGRDEVAAAWRAASTVARLFERAVMRRLVGPITRGFDTSDGRADPLVEHRAS